MYCVHISPSNQNASRPSGAFGALVSVGCCRTENQLKITVLSGVEDRQRYNVGTENWSLALRENFTTSGFSSANRGHTILAAPIRQHEKILGNLITVYLTVVYRGRRNKLCQSRLGGPDYLS